LAETQPSSSGSSSVKQRELIRLRLRQIALQAVLYGVLLFAAAGSFAWWNAWLCLALFLLTALAVGIYVLPRNPEIVAERARRHEGTRRFDRVISSLAAVVYLSMFVVAGLDAGRFRWAVLDWPWVVVGVVLSVVGVIPVMGAFGVNRHLEMTVRIQRERGHHVVSEGPYAVVRHPMYLGIILQTLAIPLILGSAWTLVPAVVCIVIVVIRTVLEDRTLRQDLPGYADYAFRTRYRLVPKVW
jgi:protein-S-isoprenylcysteine O-methyltransferase Ste14